ncbi:helix-turn-helix domain-containing protein [Paenibacillus sp. y28]|uniref:helix-turn-helix domain-containing protein n=1 Tax=Paenibacillus sp. y28 TaxID=3129110 RepID=UPI0030193B4B
MKPNWAIHHLKDRLVLLLSLLFLITSVATVFMYDRSVRSQYRMERTYYFQKNHEKAYSSIVLFTNQLQALYRQILLNKNVLEWLNHPSELASEMYRLSQIQTTFIDYINSHSGIASLYLHNKQNNMVLSTRFMLSDLPQFSHKRVFEQAEKTGDSPQQWHWLPLGQEMGNARIISMSAGIPAKNRWGTVAINIHEAYMAKTIMEGSPYLIWLDADNQVLLSTNETVRQFYEQHADYIWGAKQSALFYKGFLILSSVSDTGGWKLLTIMPESELMQGQAEKSTYKYVLVVVCLALAALLTWYFRYIRREQDKLKDVKIQRNLDDFRKGLMTDLLNGKQVPADLEEKAAEYGMNLTGSGYQVIVFQLDDYYNYLLTKTSNERFFMNKIIFNSIKWTFALQFNAYMMTTQPEKVTVLICYDEPGDAPQRKLSETIRYIQDDIKDNSGLTVCVGVSELCTELAQVHLCYSHAMRAVDYKSIYGKHAVIHYEQLSFSNASAPQHQLSPGLEDIAHYLKEGRLDLIEARLETILGELTASGQFTLDWIHALFANIMSVIMKFVIEQRIDLAQYTEEDVFISLYSYEFLEEKKAYVLKVCAIIIGVMQSKPEETSSTAALIMDYIDKHYDQPISLNILAGKLSMSPSYLSVVIKNQIGIGFVEYISKLRIQKAVKLLENERLTIMQIAEQCGYDTVHTFIRQFKKVHQVPPNEFRTRRRSEKM